MDQMLDFSKYFARWPEGESIPDILKIGCSHPNAADVTRLGDKHTRVFCLNPTCKAEWMEIDR